jgi:5-methylcytosine-specific restriction endonuclease McrA
MMAKTKNSNKDMSAGKSASERTEWLIACNLKWYDLFGAFRKLKVIDWQKVTAMNNCKKGDFVYIYCCGDNKPGSILFKGAILEVDKPRVTIDDSEFNGDLNQGPSFEVAMFREYDFDGELSFKELGGHGLKGSVMGPRIVKGELAEYLHFCDKKYIEAHKRDKTIPDTCLPISKFPFAIDEKLGGIEIGLPDTSPKESVEKHAASLDEETLKKLAHMRSTQKPKAVSQTTQTIRRDEYVARYAKTRAKGICQLCGKEAPFIGSYGEPYLESHHIVWLSKGGADSVENTVALCPNCHRKMHVVKDHQDVEKLKRASSRT